MELTAVAVTYSLLVPVLTTSVTGMVNVPPIPAEAEPADTVPCAVVSV